MIVSGINRRRFKTNLAPVGIQFLRDHHRNAGVRALTQLRMIDDHGHGLVRADAHEGVKRDGRTRFGGEHRSARTRNVNAQNQSAPGEQARLEKIPAAAIHKGIHFTPPCARSSAAR